MHKDPHPAVAPSTAPAAGTPSAKLDAYWMPFTASREFKSKPRLLAKAEGMHYWTPEGRQVLDAVAGLWCVNAGHARPKIVRAIAEQAAEMDFAPPFNMAHPKAFELAEKLVELTPAGLDKVFFTNSGSEAVDTALKMAIAYHRARGEGQRTRLIGRERGYHGVNFGGISVGGIAGNRKSFGTMVGGVDHLRHTHDLKKNALLARRARARRRARRRPRADRHPARRIDDRRGDRRAGRRLDRRAAAAQGLPRAPARDLRQARHPAHLRRGHHRLRPPRRAVRGELLQGHARPDDGRQGHHQRRRADGRGVRQARDPRRLHDRPRARRRVPARLHLLGAPARLRGSARHARDLRRRRPAHARRQDGAGVRARRPLAARVAARDRHPQHRPGRRDRARVDRRQPRQARLRRLPRVLRARRPDPHDRRHHRPVAAADRRGVAHRPGDQHDRRRAEDGLPDRHRRGRDASRASPAATAEEDRRRRWSRGACAR